MAYIVMTYTVMAYIFIERAILEGVVGSPACAGVGAYGQLGHVVQSPSRWAFGPGMRGQACGDACGEPRGATTRSGMCSASTAAITRCGRRRRYRGQDW